MIIMLYVEYCLFNLIVVIHGLVVGDPPGEQKVVDNVKQYDRSKGEDGGCAWDGEAEMFLQYEDERDPVESWSWRFLTEYQVVENVVDWPSYKFMPDGHISTLKDPQSDDWITFYPNSASYRALGPLPLPELSQSLQPRHGVIGGHLDYDVYHNGGEWLDSVFQTDLERGLTGLVHAEDHYWVEGEGLTGHGKAYKSISLGQLSLQWSKARAMCSV